MMMISIVVIGAFTADPQYFKGQGRSMLDKALHPALRRHRKKILS